MVKITARKKQNYTGREIKTLVEKVGSLSSGITHKRKHAEWQKVTEAVNPVSSEVKTLDEVKKKCVILGMRPGSTLASTMQACEPQAGRNPSSF